MKILASLIITFNLISIVTLSCNEKSVEAPKFDSFRAFEYLVKQVEFGPRVPGSREWQKCKEYIANHFAELGLKPKFQEFDFFDPYSKTQLPLVNIIASIEGRSAEPERILLMAHWDSRPRTDYPTKPNNSDKPIPGANDGASGVAVLMELANMMAKNRPEHSVEIVLVDGEDWGKSGDNEYYLLGSSEFARRSIRGKYRFGIVIDMVGDKNQEFYREVFSEAHHPELNDMIWNAAAELGASSFIDTTRHTVLDDHIPLVTSGLPAVDIIDFDYKWWHTDQDTVDKCSPESLGNIGKVLAHIIYNPQLWPAKE